jgi:hypothetical protein
LKDYLFSLLELIEHAKAKDETFQSWDKDTKGLARLLATSWMLKMDNLATRATVSVSPNEFLKKYMEDGFMEEKNMDNEKRKVRDIPFSESLIGKVESKLSKYDEYREEQFSSLFEDTSIRKECAKWRILDEEKLEEDLTLSRVWKMANDGQHVFAILTGHRRPKGVDNSKANIERNKVLEKSIRSKGYGYNKIDGYWVEVGEGGEKPEDVSSGLEESFFISKPVPESELDAGPEGKTVKNMVQDVLSWIQGDKSEDTTVPRFEEVNSGKVGFNQDAAVIKLDPTSSHIHLLFQDGDTLDLGEVEYFRDIRKEINNLPQDKLQKLGQGAGGIAYSELPKHKSQAINRSGSFRGGQLKKGE